MYPVAANSGPNIFVFWWSDSRLTRPGNHSDVLLGNEQRRGRRRQRRAYIGYIIRAFIVHPLITSASVIYDKAFATKLLQNDVEGMISLFMARAGFERRICLSSLEEEQSAGGAALSESPVAQPFFEPQDRLSILLDILNGGIKTIRSGDYQVLIYLCNGTLNGCPSVQGR